MSDEANLEQARNIYNSVIWRQNVLTRTFLFGKRVTLANQVALINLNLRPQFSCHTVCFALLCFVLLCFALLCFALLYVALLYFILLYFIFTLFYLCFTLSYLILLSFLYCTFLLCFTFIILLYFYFTFLYCAVSCTLLYFVSLPYYYLSYFTQVYQSNSKANAKKRSFLLKC